MAVVKSWTSPATGGSIDIATGGTISETWFDQTCGNQLFLGGTDGHSGSVGVGPIVYGTAGAASMGSSSYATLQSGTISSLGGTIVAHFAGRFTHDTTNTIVTIGLNIDGGTDIDIAQYQSADYINERFSLGGVAAFGGGGTASTRVVNARWKVDSGNVSSLGSAMFLEEVRP